MCNFPFSGIGAPFYKLSHGKTIIAVAVLQCEKYLVTSIVDYGDE